LSISVSAVKFYWFTSGKFDLPQSALDCGDRIFPGGIDGIDEAQVVTEAQGDLLCFLGAQGDLDPALDGVPVQFLDGDSPAGQATMDPALGKYIPGQGGQKLISPGSDWTSISIRIPGREKVASRL